MLIHVPLKVRDVNVSEWRVIIAYYYQAVIDIFGKWKKKIPEMAKVAEFCLGC